MPFDIQALLHALPIGAAGSSPGMMQGFTDALQRIQQQKLQQQQIAIQQHGAQRQDELAQAQIQNLTQDNQRSDAQLALQRLTAARHEGQSVLNALAQTPETALPAGTDPLQAQNALVAGTFQAHQAYGVPPGTPQGPLPNMTALVSEGKKRRAKALYEQAEKRYGPEAMSGDAITLQSPEFGQVKPSALRQLFETPARTSQGALAVPETGKRTPATPGSFEDYLAAPPERQAVIEAARKKYGDVGRATPNVNISMGASDTTDMAQQLVAGDLVPSQLSKRTTNYNAILAEANRISKAQTGRPYNAAKAQIDYEGGKRFVASLNGPQMVRFQGLGKSVVNTIDEVRRLGEQMNNSGVQVMNRAQMQAYLQVNGNSERGQLIAQYLGATNTLKEEFANLVNGGMAPTDAAFDLAHQQINANFGVKALNASLTEVQRLINYRLNSFSELRPQLSGGTAGPTEYTYVPGKGLVPKAAQ